MRYMAMLWAIVCGLFRKLFGKAERHIKVRASNKPAKPFVVPIVPISEVPVQDYQRPVLRAWLNGHPRRVTFETNAGGHMTALMTARNGNMVRLKRRGHPYRFWRQLVTN